MRASRNHVEDTAGDGESVSVRQGGLVGTTLGVGPTSSPRNAGPNSMLSACTGRAAGPAGGRPDEGMTRRPPWPPTVTTAAGSHLPQSVHGEEGGSPIVHARSTKSDGFPPDAEDWRERREREESRTDWMVVKRSFARTALSHRICTGIPQRRLGFLRAELASPWMAQQDSRPGCVNAAAMSGCVPRAAGRAKAAVITDGKGRPFATPSYGTSASSTPSRSVARRDGHPARWTPSLRRSHP